MRRASLWNIVLLGVLFCLLATLALLHSNEPSFQASHQNPIANQEKPVKCSKIKNPAKELPNCSAILHNNVEHICAWSDYHRPNQPDTVLNDAINDCTAFRHEYKFDTIPKSDVSNGYPIAYSISMHKNAEQFSRLFRLIYHPDNVFCVHLDRKSSPVLHEFLQGMSRCFPNLLLAPSEYVYWSGYGVLKGALNCLRVLTTLAVLNQYPWNYVFNIVAQDVPIKTNAEIVTYLKHLQGRNDIQLSQEPHLRTFWLSYRELRDVKGVPYGHTPDMTHSKLPVPHGIKILKGNFAAALSVAFVKFLMSDNRVQTLIEWLNGTAMADEHLWATVNYSKHLNAPGGYPAEGCTKSAYPWLTRYVNWQDTEYLKRKCHGKVVRDVCVFGVADIPHLVRRPELFVNKLYSEYQSVALDCVEHWLLHKQKQSINNQSPINTHQYQWINRLDHINQKYTHSCTLQSSNNSTSNHGTHLQAMRSNIQVIN